MTYLQTFVVEYPNEADALYAATESKNGWKAWVAAHERRISAQASGSR